MRGFILAISAIVLSGCVGTVTPENVAAAGPQPDNYRQKVAQSLRSSLYDPYSVRDAQISEPSVHMAMIGPLWNVCFRGNAKNRFGAYTGVDYVLFVFKGGQISTVAAESALSCQGATFGPFPELGAD